MKSNTKESRLSDNQTGFATRLFRGDVSLPITYWVFGVLIGNVAFQIILIIIEGNYINIVSNQIGAWSVIGFYWLALGYNIFMLIAVWRSAGKYQGKAIWGSLARIVVIVGTLVLIGYFVIGLKEGSDNDFALSEEIKMINSSLPNLMDDDTRLDHVSIQGGDVYYNYTLVNWLAADLDISRLISIMTPMIKTSQCENNKTRPLLDEGRKVVYMYRDKASKPITKIIVEKSDCL